MLDGTFRFLTLKDYAGNNYLHNECHDVVYNKPNTHLTHPLRFLLTNYVCMASPFACFRNWVNLDTLKLFKDSRNSFLLLFWCKKLSGK